MNLTIDNFIQLTSQGISVMDYADICQTLFARYKAIYGQEIDLDPRSADGRFIYDVATIINNACLVISQFYNNLNPNTATGYFLDILSSLTNVERESATASQATVNIRNSTNSDITITDFSTLAMKDDAGNIWSTSIEDGRTYITIQKNSNIKLIYTAPTLGKTTTSSLTFSILDNNTSKLTTSIYSFTVGQNEESDSSLRYRRASDSTFGLTVLEGLQGKLKKLEGIDDCYIYNYAGNTDETPYCYVNNVQNSMKEHSISILLRYNNVNEPIKTSIKQVIHDNITPGVSTNGTVSYKEVNPTNHLVTSVNWYKCTKQNPKITIKLDNLYNFAGDITAKKISAALVDYLNNLKINQTYSLSTLATTINGADPKYMSRSTYTFSSISGLFNGAELLNKGTYFDYGSREGVDYKTTLSADNTTITIEAL